MRKVIEINSIRNGEKFLGGHAMFSIKIDCAFCNNNDSARAFRHIARPYAPCAIMRLPNNLFIGKEPDYGENNFIASIHYICWVAPYMEPYIKGGNFPESDRLEYVSDTTPADGVERGKPLEEKKSLDTVVREGIILDGAAPVRHDKLYIVSRARKRLARFHDLDAVSFFRRNPYIGDVEDLHTFGASTKK